VQSPYHIYHQLETENGVRLREMMSEHLREILLGECVEIDGGDDDLVHRVGRRAVELSL